MNKALRLGAFGTLMGLVVFGVAGADPAYAATPACHTSANYFISTYVRTILPTVSTSNDSITCIMNQGTDDYSGTSALQDTLNYCYGKKLASDAIYGPNTAAALKSVQSKLGISADGIYGPQTRDAMNWMFWSSLYNSKVTCQKAKGGSINGL
jgi:peptidoglycan hydrolase-like protein with peptidoglycan-binding domain